MEIYEKTVPKSHVAPAGSGPVPVHGRHQPSPGGRPDTADHSRELCIQFVRRYFRLGLWWQHQRLDGKNNQVTVNDVVYTRVDSFGYFESGTKWCIGNATGAFGSYQALKITYNSSFPATIVISADGYNDLTVEVSKKGSSYTAEIKANSSSGGTEEPKPAETYPITVEQAEHGTVSANYEKAARGLRSPSP